MIYLMIKSKQNRMFQKDQVKLDIQDQVGSAINTEWECYSKKQ